MNDVKIVSVEKPEGMLKSIIDKVNILTSFVIEATMISENNADRILGSLPTSDEKCEVVELSHSDIEELNYKLDLLENNIHQSIFQARRLDVV